MLGLAILAAAAQMAGGCDPLPGAERLFASNPAVVWVGEMHGTAEHPKLFGDIVCAAAQARPKPLVALERDPFEQALWDIWLRSDGGAEARQILLAGDQWNHELQDGRSSQAMLALAERLRKLNQAGRIAGVVLIMPRMDSPVPEEHEQRMAQAVMDAGGAHPGTLIVALSGNLHARKGENASAAQSYRLAADFLPARSTISVLIRGGPGESWHCEPDGCGVHKGGGTSEAPRGVSLDGAPAGYDAVAFTGSTTSASPPAARPATWVKLPQPPIPTPPAPAAKP
jgi:hypothetical protein